MKNYLSVSQGDVINETKTYWNKQCLIRIIKYVQDVYMIQGFLQLFSMTMGSAITAK